MKSVFVLLACVAGFVFAPLAHAQSGMIDASPDPCTIGTYTNQWYVGGVPAGSEYDYEVIGKPSALGVMSSGVYGNCPSYIPYGLQGTINYFIEDSDGNAVNSNSIVLYPYFAPNGQGTQPVVSAENGAGPFGVFTYEPMGYCANFTYTALRYGSEIIYIKIGDSNVYDPVRSQDWYATSSAQYSGEVWNSFSSTRDVDISK